MELFAEGLTGAAQTRDMEDQQMKVKSVENQCFGAKPACSRDQVTVYSEIDHD